MRYLRGTRKRKTTPYFRIGGTRKQKPRNHKIGLSVIGNSSFDSNILNSKIIYELVLPLDQMISSDHSQYTLQTHRPAASLSLALRPWTKAMKRGSLAVKPPWAIVVPCFSPPVVMVIQFISLCYLMLYIYFLIIDY